MKIQLNERVRAYWEAEPCGTGAPITGECKPDSREWFERIEEHRYSVEPMIHSVAQFTRFHGSKMLEVGVGAGTDHLQWARAGCDCHGVDLTEAAIETTHKHLALNGLRSNLRRLDAERLDFADGSFDLVYSWGVIHHSERTESIVAEIDRVLKPGGWFIGMVYNLHSVLTAKMWLRQALLRGRPFRSRADVVWHHMESIGTRAFTRSGAMKLLSSFAHVELRPYLTEYDKARLPPRIARFIPDDWGWFLAFRARK